MHVPACLIRPAQTTDATQMARVFAVAIEGKAGASYGPRERAAWIARGTGERFAAMLAAPENRLLVAETPAGLAGMGGLTGSELSLLYTAPEALPGTGTRLLEAVETLARQSGLTGLTLTASRNALPFYLRHGYFVISPARKEFPNAISLVVCLMAKVFGA